MSKTKNPDDKPLVCVVDDDHAIRRSMTSLLESVGMECRTYATADSFLRDFAPDHSACLVLDIRLPGMSGLDLQEKLNEMGANIPIILITGYADVEMAVTAMRRGAFNFIEKPYRDQVLIESINEAISAERRSRSRETELAEISKRWQTLTPRELQVARMVVAGKPNKVSAYELGVSQRTVEIHRSRVMRKLQAGSLAELVKIALLVD